MLACAGDENWQTLGPPTAGPPGLASEDYKGSMRLISRKKDTLLRLAICEASPEDQEWVTVSLRAARVPCRVEPYFNIRDLEALIDKGSVDVVIWGEGAKACSLEQVLSVVGEIPVVVAASQFSNDSYSQVRMAGASDIYVRTHPELAIKVLLEQADIHATRSIAKQALEQAENVDRHHDALVEAVSDPVAYLGEGFHVKANGPYLKMLGVESFDDLEGLSILDFVDAQSLEGVKEKIKRLGRETLPSEKMAVQIKNGPKVLMIFSSANYDGEPCLQVSVPKKEEKIEVSVLPAAPAGDVAGALPPPNLEEWLRRDPASGLFSRGYFLEELENQEAGFLWVAKLRNHEEILATVGPTQLDQVVSSFGKLIQPLLPDSSIVARWTAGLVAILSEQGSADVMKQVAAKMGQEFLEVSGRSFQSALVAGGVTINEQMTSDEVVLLADEALRAAVSERDGIHLVDPLSEVKARAKEDAAMVAQLKSAISQNGFKVRFYPVVPLMGGQEHYEVLVTLPTQEEEIGPSQLLAMAEANGLGKDFNQWMCSEVVRLLVGQKNEGKDACLIVKFTPSAMGNEGILALLAERMKEADVSPGNLVININQNTVSTHAKQSVVFREAAAKHGYGIMLSGAPLDSEFVLGLMPPALSWVRPAQSDITSSYASPEAQGRLERFMGKMTANNINVLTGFVEDAVGLASLFSMGAEFAQGDFLSPPLPNMNYDFSQFG